MLPRPRIEKRRALHETPSRVCLDRAITNELWLHMASRPPRHDHGGTPSFLNIKYETTIAHYK